MAPIQFTLFVTTPKTLSSGVLFIQTQPPLHLSGMPMPKATLVANAIRTKWGHVMRPVGLSKMKTNTICSKRESDEVSRLFQGQSFVETFLDSLRIDPFNGYKL